ncbi:MAG: hypothetical protein HY238_18950 [Acidobacteria bacterium]|nr:hypothetical protein [Acidobacteriota bacterium]
MLHIQWLSMKNSLRRRSERLGLVVSILVALIWYGMWAAGAVGLFLLPTFVPAARLGPALSSVLLFIFLYWQLSPLLTASMGVSIDLRKMALYPIDLTSLFLIECLLRLMTGFEMVLLLAGLSLGMAVHAPGQAPVFVPALALFVLFNVLLSAGLRNLLERLLQRRRFREVFLFFIVMASALPQLIVLTGSGRRVGRHIWEASRFVPQSLLPPGSLVAAYLGRTSAADWVALIGWSAAAAGFGFLQFRRSFRFDFAAARADALRLPQDRETWGDRLYQLPARLLPDPAAALVEKELRYFLRSPRFRFLFLMACTFGVVIWLPFGMRHRAAAGPMQSSFLAVISLYGLLLLGQVTFLNSFGFDRSAIRYFFWMPISPLLLLAAKNLVGMIFVTLEVFALALVCVPLRMLS